MPTKKNKRNKTDINQSESSGIDKNNNLSFKKQKTEKTKETSAEPPDLDIQSDNSNLDPNKLSDLPKASETKQQPQTSISEDIIVQEEINDADFDPNSFLNKDTVDSPPDHQDFSKKIQDQPASEEQRNEIFPKVQYKFSFPLSGYSYFFPGFFSSLPGNTLSTANAPLAPPIKQNPEKKSYRRNNKAKSIPYGNEAQRDLEKLPNWNNLSKEQQGQLIKKKAAEIKKATEEEYEQDLKKHQSKNNLSFF